MVTHRSIALAALLASACASPTRMEASAWRDRVKTLEAAPVEAALEVELPATLKGPLLAKSFLIYELRRGDKDVWDIRFQGPERNRQSIDSWAAVTLTSPGNESTAVVKSAKVYSGRVNVARRGKKSDDELLLLALAFTERSLFDACEVLAPMSPEAIAAPENVERTGGAYVGASLSGFAASFTVQRSKTIASLMAKVMQWPSGLLGVDHDAPVSFLPDVLAATPCNTDFGPGWRVPLEVLVDENQAFVGQVTVVEPGGALNLSAGIVEVSGFAPHRPGEPVRLRLTGAHAPRTDHLKPEAVDTLLTIKPRSKSKGVVLP